MIQREHFLILSMQHIGIPYLWGGKDPRKGLDCSGMAEICLRILGIDPPGIQNSQHLYDHFISNGTVVLQHIAGDQSRMQESLRATNIDLGDLMFFGKSVHEISHVGVYLGLDMYLESAGGDHTTTTMAEAVRRNAFVKVSSINHRKDLVSIIRPNGISWARPFSPPG